MEPTLPFAFTRQPGEFDLGEQAPIVSQCAGCNTPLTVDKIHVLEDGEHVCCHNPECEERYLQIKRRGEIY